MCPGHGGAALTTAHKCEHTVSHYPDQPVMSYVEFFRDRENARYGAKGRVGRRRAIPSQPSQSDRECQWRPNASFLLRPRTAEQCLPHSGRC